jgi:hypothetical protein
LYLIIWDNFVYLLLFLVNYHSLMILEIGANWVRLWRSQITVIGNNNDEINYLIIWYNLIVIAWTRKQYSRRFIVTTNYTHTYLYYLSSSRLWQTCFPYLMREVFLRDGISFITHIVFINSCKSMLRLSSTIYSFISLQNNFLCY